MAQMWAGNCSLIMGAAAQLKDEAVSHRLRQAGIPPPCHAPAPFVSNEDLSLVSSWLGSHPVMRGGMI